MPGSNETDILLRILGSVDPSVASSISNAKTQMETLQAAAGGAGTGGAGAIAATLIQNQVEAQKRLQAAQKATSDQMFSQIKGQAAAQEDAAQKQELRVTRIRQLQAATHLDERLAAKADADLAKQLESAKLTGFQQLQKTSQGLTLVLGGLAAALVGIGRGIADRVIEFDKLSTTLEVVMHNTAAAHVEMQKLISFSQNAPFEVKSVVEAGVKLAVFRQSIDHLLPLAGELAAAMGKDINEAALALGKAFEGSATGVRVLTNTFGISRVQLRENGAEMTKHGQILLQTQEQLEKFRSATEAIIRNNYLGAMERQMGTLAGAATNLSDVFNNTMRGIGQSVEPTMIAITHTATDVLKAFQAIPAPLVSAGAGLAIFATGISVLGAGLAGTSLALTRIVPMLGLLTEAELSAAAASGVLGVAQASLSAAIAKSSASLLAFAATPVGTALIAIAAVGAAIVRIRAAYEEDVRKEKEMQHELEESSKAFAKVHGEVQGLTSALDQVSHGAASTASGVHDMSARLLELQKILKGMSAADLAVVLASKGFSVDEIQKSIDLHQKDLKTQQDSIEVLNKVQAAYKKLSSDQQESLRGREIFQDNWLRDLVKEGTLTVAQAQSVREMFKSHKVSADGFTDALNIATVAANKLMEALGLEVPVLDKWKTLEATFAEITASTGQVKDYFSAWHKGTDTVGELNEKVAITSQRLSEVQGKLAQAGLPSDAEGLRRNLLTLNPQGTDEEKEQIKVSKEALALFGEKANAEKALLDKTINDRKEAFEQKKALGETSLQDEVNFAKQQQALLENSDKATDAEKLRAANDTARAIHAKRMGDAEEFLRQERVKTNAETEAAGQSKTAQIAIARSRISELLAYEKKYGDDSKAIAREIQTERNRISSLSVQQEKEQQNQALDEWIKAHQRAIKEIEKNSLLSADVTVSVMQKAAKDARAEADKLAADDPRKKRLTDFAETQEEAAVVKREEMAKGLITLEEHIQSLRVRGAERDIASLKEQLRMAQEKAKLDEKVRVGGGNAEVDKIGEINAKLATAIESRLQLELSAIDQKWDREQLKLGNSEEARSTVAKARAAEERNAIEDARNQAQQLIDEQKRGDDQHAEAVAKVREQFAERRQGGISSPLESQAERNAVAKELGGGATSTLGNFSLGEFTATLGGGPKKSDTTPLERLASQFDTSLSGLDKSLNVPDGLKGSIDRLTAAITGNRSVTADRSASFDFARSGGYVDQFGGRVAAPGGGGDTTIHHDQSDNSVNQYYVGPQGLPATPDLQANQEAMARILAQQYNSLNGGLLSVPNGCFTP